MKKVFQTVADYNDAYIRLLSNPKLSNKEKIRRGKRLIRKLNRSRFTKWELMHIKGDIPTTVKAITNPDYSDWIADPGYARVNFPKNKGLDLSKGIAPITPDSTVPDVLIRYGSETGTNFTTLMQGRIPSNKDRALPYVFVTGRDRVFAFHLQRYCDIIDLIERYGSGDSNALADINEYTGLNITEAHMALLAMKHKRYCEEYAAELAKPKEYVKYGVIGYVNKFKHKHEVICKGGAIQVNTMLPEASLKDFGVLVDIKLSDRP